MVDVAELGLHADLESLVLQVLDDLLDRPGVRPALPARGHMVARIDAVDAAKPWVLAVLELGYQDRVVAVALRSRQLEFDARHLGSRYRPQGPSGHHGGAQPLLQRRQLRTPLVEPTLEDCPGIAGDRFCHHSFSTRPCKHVGELLRNRPEWRNDRLQTRVLGTNFLSRADQFGVLRPQRAQAKRQCNGSNECYQKKQVLDHTSLLS